MARPVVLRSIKRNRDKLAAAEAAAREESAEEKPATPAVNPKKDRSRMTKAELIAELEARD